MRTEQCLECAGHSGIKRTKLYPMSDGKRARMCSRCINLRYVKINGKYYHEDEVREAQ